jgi:hypothetical protein
MHFRGVNFSPLSPIAWNLMKHKEIRWNPHTQEWFCVVCGRTSDHVNEADARTELEMYECQLPSKGLIVAQAGIDERAEKKFAALAVCEEKI